jgi:hypothetical protein
MELDFRIEWREKDVARKQNILAWFCQVFLGRFYFFVCKMLFCDWARSRFVLFECKNKTQVEKEVKNSNIW